jgi:hypothetical protein
MSDEDDLYKYYDRMDERRRGELVTANPAIAFQLSGMDSDYCGKQSCFCR